LAQVTIFGSRFGWYSCGAGLCNGVSLDDDSEVDARGMEHSMMHTLIQPVL